MRRLSYTLIVVTLLVNPLLSAQEKPKKIVEVIEMKGGDNIIGIVINLTADSIEVELTSGGSATCKLSDLKPSSIFRLRAARIDDKSAVEHSALGDFAFDNGLYPDALHEYAKAIALDDTLKEKLQKKIDEARANDARRFYEEGVALMKEEKLEDAAKKFSIVRTKYAGTDYDEKAKVELEKLANLIKERNDKKAKELEAAKAKVEDKLKSKKLQQLKSVYDGAAAELAAGQKLINEGLTVEGQGNISGAAKSWMGAEQRLQMAVAGFDSLLASAKDVDILDACRERKKEATMETIRLYNMLGNAWISQLNTFEARKWINKALIVDPNDRTAQELKLRLTDLMIREKLPPEKR